MKLAILGAGQLGGSFALALKQAGADVAIAAYDSNIRHAEHLKSIGAVDAVCTTSAEATKDADIVLLASPLRTYPSLARAIAPALKDGIIVTDVGSVKGSMEKLRALLPNARIVPGHPIAGTEKSGPEVARVDLFRGRLCLLTPADNADSAAVRVVETLWHLVGADVLHMPTSVHDQIYAHVSHLPHFIAFISAQFFYRQGVRVEEGDTLLRQFLRISRSSPRMWTDVALENREAMLLALTAYSSVLNHFIAELESGDPGTTADTAILSRTLLPRILASTLISVVTLYERQASMALKPFAGAGMRDVSAPATQAPDADIESISQSAGAVATLLKQLLVSFHNIERYIGAEDEAGLFAALTAMAADAHALVASKN